MVVIAWYPLASYLICTKICWACAKMCQTIASPHLIGGWNLNWSLSCRLHTANQSTPSLDDPIRKRERNIYHAWLSNFTMGLPASRFGKIPRHMVAMVQGKCQNDAKPPLQCKAHGRHFTTSKPVLPLSTSLSWHAPSVALCVSSCASMQLLVTIDLSGYGGATTSST
jgi:hypothetical protein